MKKLVIGITAEGSVNLLLGQLKYFKSLGYKVYLLGPYSKRSSSFCKDEGCEHLIIDIEREISIFQDLKTLKQIFKIFKNIRPDIINLGTPTVSLLGMIAGYFTGVKVRIYTCRGFRFEHEKGFKRKILIIMEKLTSILSHKIICISNSVLELGINNEIFNRKKSIVIQKGSSNGINLDLFNPKIKKHQDLKNKIIKKYDLDKYFVFGFLGRVVDRKGINELFDVFNNIYEKNTEIKLLIVGPFEMNQINDKFLVQKIDNHPGIINFGKVKQEDVPALMLAMNVFVLPAWWEGFGNTLIQAAAMGIPVISTKGTGTIDAVSNGFNGKLIPVKNKNKLREAMILMIEDDNLRKKYSHNGLLWAKEFNREMIWNDLNKIYKEFDYFF